MLWDSRPPPQGRAVPADRERQWGLGRARSVPDRGVCLGARKVPEVLVAVTAARCECACCPWTGHSSMAKRVNSMFCMFYYNYKRN